MELALLVTTSAIAGAVLWATLVHIVSDIGKGEKEIMADLKVIEDQVTANTSVIGSAVALLKVLKDQLDAAGTDPVKLKALSDQLASDDKALADAVVANTPAAV